MFQLVLQYCTVCYNRVEFASQIIAGINQCFRVVLVDKLFAPLNVVSV